MPASGSLPTCPKKASPKCVRRACSGGDRSAFIARQLATAFPDTPYRASLTPPQEGGTLGAMMPTRQLLFGINAVETLDRTIEACPAPVAGVWPISMLLSSLCRRKDLPPTLVVVLPGADALRIVYLHQGVPILTRLTGTPNQAPAQVEEIVRTLNYLEKIQSLPQPRAGHPVLFLGAGQPAREALLEAGLRPIERVVKPGRERAPMQDLFDIVVRSPIGQLAPLERRIQHLSLELDRQSRTSAKAVFLVGLVAAISSGYAMYANTKARQPLDASIASLSNRAAELDAQIARFNVAPEQVRKAIALDEKEIASVPALGDHLALIAGAIAVDPNLRLKDLHWRLLPPGEIPCMVAANPENPEPAAAEQAAAEPARQAEIGFGLTMPESYGARDRAARLNAVSTRLAGIQGAIVWKDAAKRFTRGSLSGGAAVANDNAYVWCLSLPGELPLTPGAATGASPEAATNSAATLSEKGGDGSKGGGAAMNPTTRIFHGARRGLALLAGVVVFTLIVVLGGVFLRAQMEQDRLDAQASIGAWHNQLTQKKDDLENIARHIAEYDALKQKGVVGRAEREAWVEQFVAAKEALGPIRGRFTYSLAPPVAMGADPQAVEGAAPPPDAALMHDLAFEIEGLHEEELLRLIRDFRSKAKGQFRVERCQLESPLPTGMSAKCVLRFFTLPDDAHIVPPGAQ
jgi:hypothetical protein